MIFGKAIVWTARMLLVGLFVTFLLIMGNDFSENITSSQELEFQKMYFDVMPLIVQGGVVKESVFAQQYFEDYLGEQKNLGFHIRLQNKTETLKETYYREDYYRPRIYLIKGEGYTEYSGVIPVTYESEEADLYYSFLVAK